MALTNGVLADQVWPQNSSSLLRPMLLAVAGSLCVAASAQISVPLYPVPVTMQTFAVLLIGLAFGARLGAATLALYAAEAAIGLPVLEGFAGGLAKLAGPTGGYIAGFIVAAGLVGWLAERGWSRPIANIALAMVLGTAVIYLFGVTWLSGFVGSLSQAVEFGLTPFLIGDVLKAALAAICLPIAWQVLRRNH